MGKNAIVGQSGGPTSVINASLAGVFESCNSEVNALKNASEEVLSKVEEHKQTVEKCKELLGELDTTFRDQQKTNERLDQMENKLDEIFKFVKSQKQE